MKKSVYKKKRSRSSFGEIREDSDEKGDVPSPKKPRRPWSPMNYLLWLQGRREHSQVELRQKLVFKLREKGLTEEHDPDEIISRLVELDLQSDQRFLDGNVRMASSGGRGPGWVKQRLYRHNLDSEAVESALAEIDQSHWETEAYDLARRRFGNGPYPMPLRVKAGNFLIRRGYSIDLVRRITTDQWPEEEVIED